MDDKNESDTPIHRECEGTENKLSTKSTTSLMLKPNSNTNTSLPTNSSPNNSNSDNLSAIDNNAVDEHELNCTDKRGRNKAGNSGSGSNSTKDDAGHCENPKSVSNSSAICSLGPKEEAVLSVKKEERSLSPVSPVGFDVVSTLPNVDIAAGRGGSGKLDEMPIATNKNNNEKISSPGNNGIPCKDEFNSSNLVNVTPGNGNSSIGNTSLAPQQSFNNNCLELMQQQNHVFVFSTQLANKAAESVLSGKYHSIIAYHCTQPQTKNFLDEFFMKNPMKISKLPPRNPNNMANQNAGNPWTNSGVGNISKASQKSLNNNKAMGFPTMLNTNADQKIVGKITPFPEGDGDTDLMQCWDSTGHNALGNSDLKAVADGNLSTAAHNVEKLAMGINDSIPFLQGRKIPDENLTPQQRQHREEQLAKLKKMNQFLFPENEATQASKLSAAENLPPGMGNMLLNVSSGPPLRNNMLQNPQKLPLSTMCETENSLPNIGMMTGQNEQIAASLQSKTTPSAAGLSCDGINSNIVNSNSSIGPCGPPASNVLMSNTSGDVATMPIASGNGFNSGDDVINSMEWAKMQNPNMSRINNTPAGVGSTARTNPMQNASGIGSTQRTQPPPPYHTTQRSASVPIATQSPNPASPNNPTSNLSMPSPASASVPGGRTTGGPITNSPNTDMISTTSTSNPKTGGFSQEPNNNPSRNRQLSSNPSTPLSHMSPKDLDNFNPNTPVGDSQQPNSDNRFPPSSPNYNFPLNNYKSPLERPGGVSAATFMGGTRRTDNLPLNPNSNRMPQGKLGPNVPFDPISSLAQMSQQLSCASSGPVGATGGNNVSGGDLGIPTSNIGLNHHQSIDGMIQQTMVEGGIMDSGGIIPGGGPPFGPNNMNSMMMSGPMNPQHRLLNPKMCGGFNNNNVPVGSGFHGIAPNPHHHRLRMSGGMNFGNFNVSPNVQVKASTPNTIQYMPVRPQNNNSNMRAPPSLDFLPRYPLNPGQPPDNHGPHGVHLMGIQADVGNKLNSNISSSNNPVSGNNSAPSSVINFFQHCNQDQEDMGSSGGNPGGMIPTSHDMMRGLRPMLRPGSGNPNPNIPFSGNQDPLDCADIFGNSNPNSNPNQMFQVSGGKPGSNKMGSGMVMGGNTGSLCSNLGGNLPVLEHGGMMGPGVMPNTNNGSNNQLSSGTSNNMNYKSFVGPSSNDLKYAQQYHSFQQQLYATSTRSQQNGNNLTSPANIQNANSPFYNK